jgi:hypothetical protein
MSLRDKGFVVYRWENKSIGSALPYR